MDKNEIIIEHDNANNRVKTIINGIEAHVQYRIDEETKTLDIRHTIVPKEIGGRGIAAKLVEFTYNWAVAQNLKIVSTCSYATVWLKRHGIKEPESLEAKNSGNSCGI
ncbi:MAG: GNAT family N-acetyltransferase [Bacteroidales bacterium]